MDQRLRQRGWSIQSSDGQESSQQRGRAESTATEPSLSHDEKVHLMNSAFEDVNDDVEIVIPTGNIKRDDSNEESEDYVAMFGEDRSRDGYDEKEEAYANNPKKRRKIEPSEKSGGTVDDDGGDQVANVASTTQRVVLTREQQENLDLAKSKLSKWAARLFDPNRPRGLVEPPKTIPLNDEFLTAFGKREKEYDELSGRKIDIDQTSLDVVDVYDSDDEGNGDGKVKAKINYSEISAGKVKISNLNYATSAETLARACEVIGPVINVNLILDEYRNSTGRAYVVFTDDDTAQHFVDRMNEQTLDGRVIRVSLSAASASKSKRKDGGGGGMKKENRYWEKDISKKCNHCGVVGHTMNNCPNGDDQFKPCPMCAEVGHQMYSCPLKSVCFNCGIPGHVSRECQHRRLDRRMICTICHSRHHHRSQCNERPWNVPSQDAVCMECGKVGHLMCSEMKWFFGLTGLTCFNCGGNDHVGFECKRPNLDQCAKNPGLAQQEVERVDAIYLGDQLSNQRNRSTGSRDRDQERNRARSAPPSRDNGYSRRY